MKQRSAGSVELDAGIASVVAGDFLPRSRWKQIPHSEWKIDLMRMALPDEDMVLQIRANKQLQK